MDGDSGQSPMVVLPVPPPPEPKLLVPIKTEKSRGRGHYGGDSHGGGGNDPTPAWLPFLILALLVLVVMVALGMFWRGGSLTDMFHHRAQFACPRPAAPVEEQPQFNAQQRDIRDLRRRAFRGDFFAQLELASRYEGRHPADKNLQDPVEAAVWYSLALANPDGYAPTGEGYRADTFRGRAHEASLYDDCRHVERGYGYATLDRLLAQMSTDERDKVRDRATYVLSTQGSPGLRTLGRLHDAAYGPFGEPPDDGEARRAWSHQGWQNAIQLFGHNGVDAYMYDYLAMQGGDEAAFILLKDVERSSGQPGLADAAEERARRWVPPVEFYPPDAPDSGVPHSDESEPSGEVERTSLYRIGELPFRHVAQALAYLHIIAKPTDGEVGVGERDIETFQAMLGRPVTGHLTPMEKVRAIQFAAVNGSPHAQLVLAVMYAQGVGVPPDYARAFHWFEQADRQGSPEAKFAIATYFSEGLAGVADQEKAAAVVHQLDAALSGFRPSVGRLRDMLERVSPGRRRGWLGYSRPEEQAYETSGPGGPGGPGASPPDGYSGAPPASGDPSASFGPGQGEDWSAAAGDTRRSDHRGPPRTRKPTPRGAFAPNDERGPR